MPSLHSPPMGSICPAISIMMGHQNFNYHRHSDPTLAIVTRQILCSKMKGDPRSQPVQRLRAARHRYLRQARIGAHHIRKWLGCSVKMGGNRPKARRQAYQILFNESKQPRHRGMGPSILVTIVEMTGDRLLHPLARGQGHRYPPVR